MNWLSTITSEGFPILRSNVILLTAGTSVLVAFGVKKLLNRFKVTRCTDTSSETSLAHYVTTLEERKPPHLWNTAMFFPDFNADQLDSTTHQFLWYFSQARTSVRVCIYNFSFPELQSIFAQLYEKGLCIQFICGAESTAEHLRKLSLPCGLVPRNCSIPCTDQLMHHKFAVIDDEAVLVGSMNWTTEGIFNNKENICVSTNKTHVEKYLGEFYRLLKICEEAKTFY